MQKFKKHLSFKKQIELLKSRGLKINNYNKLKIYLKKYNYQNLINGYNDPFLKNHSRQQNLYDCDASDLAIIDTFNFDKDIALKSWENISNFERMLSSSISYCISEKMDRLGFKHGNIFSLEGIYWNSIFNNTKSKEEIINEIYKYHKKCDSNLLNKYNNINQIPIWSLILLVPFGSLSFLFDILSEDIRYNIIKSFKRINATPVEFSRIIYLFVKVRNKIAHNNVFYNLCVGKKYKKQISNFLTKNNLKIKISESGLRIYDVVLILNKIQNNNFKNEFYLIYKQSIKENKNLSKTAKEYISKKMNIK